MSRRSIYSGPGPRKPANKIREVPILRDWPGNGPGPDSGLGLFTPDTASYGHGQAQADIKAIGRGFGQAQAFILNAKSGFGQAQAQIKAIGRGYGQAQTDIKAIGRGFGQANADIKTIGRGFGQAQGFIQTSKFGHGQAQANIVNPYYLIDTFTRTRALGIGLGTPDLGPDWIDQFDPADDQYVEIDGTRLVIDTSLDTFLFTRAESPIGRKNVTYYQEFIVEDTSILSSLGFNIRTNYDSGNYVDASYDASIGDWTLQNFGAGTVDTDTFTVLDGVTYAIKLDGIGTTVRFKIWDKSGAEPGTWLLTITGVDSTEGGVAFYIATNTGTDNIYVDNINVISSAPETVQRAFGQAQAQIVVSVETSAHGQAQATIKAFARLQFGNAQAAIKAVGRGYGQAQAMIQHRMAFGQAQATIRALNVRTGFGQAQAKINSQGTVATGQAQAFIAGINARYIVNYNGYQLPGYAQGEAFQSDIAIQQHVTSYLDSSLSEYTGLQNKIVSLKMKVWEQTYLDCKNQVQKAATLLRTPKGFTNLHVAFTDRYYVALVKSITTQQHVGINRTLDYDVEFECMPWLLRDTVTTISGTGLIDTDQVSRDIYNGGWSPVTLRLDGTDITVSGYTQDGDFAGYISVSGAVSNLVVDSENYTATINGTNANGIMYTTDYRLYVGPGKTFFDISGATSCVIEYRDRWYL